METRGLMRASRHSFSSPPDQGEPVAAEFQEMWGRSETSSASARAQDTVKNVFQRIMKESGRLAAGTCRSVRCKSVRGS